MMLTRGVKGPVSTVHSDIIRCFVRRSIWHLNVYRPFAAHGGRDARMLIRPSRKCRRVPVRSRLDCHLRIAEHLLEEALA